MRRSRAILTRSAVVVGIAMIVGAMLPTAAQADDAAGDPPLVPPSPQVSTNDGDGVVITDPVQSVTQQQPTPTSQACDEGQECALITFGSTPLTTTPETGSVPNGVDGPDAAPAPDPSNTLTDPKPSESAAPSASAKSQAQPSAIAPSVPPADWVEIPDWCIAQAENGQLNSYGVRRTAACAIGDYTLTIERIQNGVATVVGEQVGLAYHYLYSSSDSRNWANEIKVAPSTAWGRAVGASIRLTPTCVGDTCVKQRDESPVQAPAVGDAAYGVSYWRWSMAGRGLKAYGDGGWTVEAKGVGVPTWSNVTDAVAPALRCDTVIAGAGCVWPQKVPEIGYLDAYYPTFWEHLNNSFWSGLPGQTADSGYIGQAQGTALHRANQTVAAANRAAACPGSFPRPSGTSCDEYPFASTYEGAASGAGPGRTFPGCGITALPTDVTGPGYSACMIDSGENTRAGSALQSQLYQRMRVLDGDAFSITLYRAV